MLLQEIEADSVTANDIAKTMSRQVMCSRIHITFWQKIEESAYAVGRR